MDQIKIGRFIASCRKRQGFTQAELAERLGVTDRAVSKWETGRSLPDTGLMRPLCALLEIDVNELLLGERIMEGYDKKAEENLLELRREIEAQNRFLLWVEIVLTTPTVILSLVLFSLAANLPMPRLLAVALTVLAMVAIAEAAFVAVGIEQRAGYYACSACGHRHRPTYWQANLAPHVGRSRYMKCPACGMRTLQKKVLTKDE